ncbi:hypothetical protein X975_14119, partial [Stegodyphus mimosarum]
MDYIKDRFEVHEQAKNIKNSLRLFLYKIRSHQAIPMKAVQQRVDFAKQILTMINNDRFDVSCIWFTDEAHFHLNGIINKQNWRFWGAENPHLCEEEALHSPEVTAWAAVFVRGITGLFFGRETITTQCYVTILEQFVSTQLALEDRPGIEWFMQDGARPHRTDYVFRFLHEYFLNRVAALDYPQFTDAGIIRSPYSPDLSPCDFFLWGALKDTVYRNNPATLDELESLISLHVIPFPLRHCKMRDVKFHCSFTPPHCFERHSKAINTNRFGDTGIVRYPYSPDLSLCDFFLWGALKDTVYRNNPATLDELESLIGVACDFISIETLQDA